MIKKTLKKFKNILLSTYLNVNYVKADFKSQFISNNLRGNKEYPTTISESFLKGVSASEGCKFYQCKCDGEIEIGRFVSIYGPGTQIVSKQNKIKIGSFSSIATNVIIQEYNHRYDKVSSYYMNKNIFKDQEEMDVSTSGSIHIEEDVWIGANSIVLSGVKIGRGSIIGAGSVVTKDVPRYSIAVGNPARVINKRFSDDVIHELEKSEWWNWDLDKLKSFRKDLNKSLVENEKVFKK